MDEEDEFQLQELGTIEEMTLRAQERRKKRMTKDERKFYDANSIGRRPRRASSIKKSQTDNKENEDQSQINEKQSSYHKEDRLEG